MIWLAACTGAAPPASKITDTGIDVPSTTPSDSAEGDTVGDTALPSTGDTGGTEGTPGVAGLVGVGYGGIRVISRDGGASWSDMAAFAPAGGDDENLLRAVAYGDGLWLATGWKWVTSPDGVQWTDHGLIADAEGWPLCNIVEGLAWADGAFYAACADWYGDGYVYRSVDAETWAMHGAIGPTGGHLFLAYREGTFAAYGDSGISWVSPDAATWTELSGISRATWCDGAFVSEADCAGPSWFGGAYFTTAWPDTIRRSTDGTAWSDVYVDPGGNSLYQPRAIAEGIVSAAGERR